MAPVRRPQRIPVDWRVVGHWDDRAARRRNRKDVPLGAARRLPSPVRDPLPVGRPRWLNCIARADAARCSRVDGDDPQLTERPATVRTPQNALGREHQSLAVW